MANDYSMNQFFNFQTYENNNLLRTNLDNAKFKYPGKTAPPIYSKDIEGIDSPIERGFIRGIIPQAYNEANYLNSGHKTNKKNPLNIRRCFFQFNPSLILRNVSASSSTLNPLLQDPTQLLQPIPGQASFEFNLLFNREQEVSNKNLSSNTLNVENNEGLFDQTNINQIGVLHDLQVLDSIIGQSITKDALDALSTYYVSTDTQKNATTVESTNILDNGDTTIVYSDGSTKTTDNDGKEKKTTPPTTVHTPFNSDLFKTGANAALGNSAFLSPMPIRIVFSSLFMVEGFVTSSAVAFQKFSKTMVPTVCTVTLNVQAMYFGFARKKSFLSDAILLGATENRAQEDKNAIAQGIAQELMSYLSFEIKNTFFNALTFQIEDDPNPPPTSLAAAVDRTTFRKWVNFERTYKSDGSAGVGEKLGTFGNAGGDTNTHIQYRFNGANASNYGSFNGTSDYTAANPFKMTTLKDEKKLIEKNIKDGIISNLKIQSLNLYIITLPSGETETSIRGALEKCASVTDSVYSSHIIVGQECVFGADATDKIGVLSTTRYDLFTKTNKKPWADPDDWESIAGLTLIAFIFEATFSCETAGNTITQTKWAVKSGIDVDNTTTFGDFNVGNYDGNVNTSYTISSPGKSIGK